MWKKLGIFFLVTVIGPEAKSSAVKSNSIYKRSELNKIVESLFGFSKHDAESIVVKLLHTGKTIEPQQVPLSTSSNCMERLCTLILDDGQLTLQGFMPAEKDEEKAPFSTTVDLRDELEKYESEISKYNESGVSSLHIAVQMTRLMEVKTFPTVTEQGTFYDYSGDRRIILSEKDARRIESAIDKFGDATERATRDKLTELFTKLKQNIQVEKNLINEYRESPMSAGENEELNKAHIILDIGAARYKEEIERLSFLHHVNEYGGYIKDSTDSSHIIFQILLFTQEEGDRRIQELVEETDMMHYLHEYLEDDLAAIEKFMNKMQEGVDQSLSDENRNRFNALLRELERTVTLKRLVAENAVAGMLGGYYSDSSELENATNSTYLVLQMMSIMKAESAGSIKGQLEFGGISRYLSELLSYLYHIEGLLARRKYDLSEISDSVSDTIEATTYRSSKDADFEKFAELLNDLKHITELEREVIGFMLNGMLTYEKKVERASISSPSRVTIRGSDRQFTTNTLR